MPVRKRKACVVFWKVPLTVIEDFGVRQLRGLTTQVVEVVETGGLLLER